MNHAQQRTYSLFTVSFTAFRRSSHHLSVRLLEPNPLAGSPQSHFHTYWLRPSPTNRIIECLVTSCGEAADVRGKMKEGGEGGFSSVTAAVKRKPPEKNRKVSSDIDSASAS